MVGAFPDLRKLSDYGVVFPRSGVLCFSFKVPIETATLGPYRVCHSHSPPRTPPQHPHKRPSMPPPSQPATPLLTPRRPSRIIQPLLLLTLLLLPILPPFPSFLPSPPLPSFLPHLPPPNRAFLLPPSLVIPHRKRVPEPPLPEAPALGDGLDDDALDAAAAGFVGAGLGFEGAGAGGPGLAMVLGSWGVGELGVEVGCCGEVCWEGFG